MAMRVFFLITGLVVFVHFPLSGQTLYWDEDGLPVCTADGWQRNPRVVTDGDRGAIIAWDDLRVGSNPAIYAARVTAGGQLPWTEDGIVVSTHLRGQRLAGIVSDGSGGAYLAWWNKQSGNDDIFMQHIDDAGNDLWTEGGIAVCDADGRQQWAELISDGEGGVIITWHDRRGDDNDIYAQRYDSQGEALWEANGVLVSGATGDQSYPQLASDQSGGAFIVWMDRRSEDDIYAQRVRSDGSLAWNDDLAVCKEPNRQIAPKVVPFGADGVSFFWQDYRFGNSSSSLYVQVVSADGEKQYAEDYQVSQSATAQTGMFLTDDGVQGALAIWTDFRDGGDGDIFMRRILADGTIIGDFGNALCVFKEVQERPQIISDGFGGGFGVWQDKRNGFDYDLYMNRVSHRGLTDHPEWNRAEGVLLVAADNNQLTPQIIPSGNGAAIVVWYDGRVMDGVADIYAQRVAWAPWVDHPDSVDFGITLTGSEVFDTVRVTNTGAISMEITNIRRASNPATTNPQDFTFYQTFTIPLTLPPDSSIDIVISFKAGDVGDRISELRISSNAPEDPAVIPLHGIGTSPVIEVKSIHAFTTTKVGYTNEERIEAAVRNTGDGVLLITRLEITGPDAIEFDLLNAPPLPVSVETGGRLDFLASVTPSIVGPREAELRVYSNASENYKKMALKGNGALPSLSIIPLAVHFDSTQATKTGEVNLRLRNTSGVELLISGMRFEGADADQFEFEARFPIKIAGNNNHDISLRFKPTSTGKKRAQLMIESDDPKSPKSVSVDGPAILLSASPVVTLYGFELHQNYPNPYSISGGGVAMVQTTIPPGGGSTPVSLELYDMLGRMLLRIHEGELQPGKHSFRIDPQKHALRPGVYVLRMTAAGSGKAPLLLSRSMVVTK